MPPKLADQTKLSELDVLINQRWPGKLRRASDPTLRIERLPTGLFALDVRLGGGVARGRYTVIEGAQHVGKTATTYSLIATTQAAGFTCGFVDLEGSFDPVFAEHQGVNLDELRMPQHGITGNVAFDMVETFLRSEEYGVVVIDSIAALLPKEEEEADLEAGGYGTAQAKLMSRALRKLTPAIGRTAVVFINQQREAIGVTFGKRTTSPGGRAITHYAGQRIEMVKTETLKASKKVVNPSTGEVTKADKPIGHRVLARVEKDKTGPNVYAETSLVFDYRLGSFDPIEDLLYLGRYYGLISRTGQKWSARGSTEAIVGRPRFKRWLRDHSEVARDLRDDILDAVTNASEDAEAVNE